MSFDGTVLNLCILKIEIVCQTPEHHQKASKPPWIYFEHQELFLLHEVDIKIHLTIYSNKIMYKSLKLYLWVIYLGFRLRSKARGE